MSLPAIDVVITVHFSWFTAMRWYSLSLQAFMPPWWDHFYLFFLLMLLWIVCDFLFGCAMRLVKSYFPDQGLNPWPSAVKVQRPDHWITTGIPNVCGCFYRLFSERKTPFYPPPLLNWKVAQEKVPWGIVLLLGGGFAVANGCEVTSSLLGRWQGWGAA